MRATGSLDAVPTADRGDHVCWVHGGDDDAAFDDAVRTFLSGGLARGERLLCVGERVIDPVRVGAAPLTGVEQLIADGTLELVTVDDAYAATGPFSADRQFAYYDAATRRALAEGYAGLRVVAEVSVLAADPSQRAELVRWEHRADRYIAQGPGMTAMCAYAGSLSTDALSDVSSAHPAAHTPPQLPQFRMYVDDERVVLTGSVDLSEAARLARLLDDPPGVSPVVLDLSRLEFVDVAGCRVIARWAGELRARGVSVEIRGASRLVCRVWELLGLDEGASVTSVQEVA